MCKASGVFFMTYGDLHLDFRLDESVESNDTELKDLEILFYKTK